MTPRQLSVPRVREGLRRVFGGRSVSLVGPGVAGGAQTVRALIELGAERVLVVSSPSAAAQARTAGAQAVGVNLEAAHSVLTQRAWDAMLADPPLPVATAIRDFDPAGEGLILIFPWCETSTLLGRSAYGARRPDWSQWEDKLIVGDLWSAAGLSGPPHAVVEISDAPAAAAHLDRGQGTVWAGDALGGRNAGVLSVRWVPGPAEAAEAVRAMGRHHRRVRVTPFLPGRPCGIHGVVLEDGVAVFRPVEHVTVRAQTEPRLRVVGVSTTWDPPAWGRAEMRDAARKVGVALSRLSGFRSSFTVDGVLTADGFRPTECNPRWGAAIAYVDEALPGFCYALLHYAVAAGVAVPFGSAGLEALVVRAADARRRAALFAELGTWPGGEGERWVRRADDGWAPAAEAVADGRLEAARGGAGWFVRIGLDPRRLRPGPAYAAEAVAGVNWLERTAGLAETGMRPGNDPLVHIEDATSTDAMAVGRLRAAAWRLAYPGIVPQQYLDAMSDDLPEWLFRLFPAPAGTISLVARDPSGAVAGFAIASVHDEDQIGEVALFYRGSAVGGCTSGPDEPRVNSGG